MVDPSGKSGADGKNGATGMGDGGSRAKPFTQQQNPQQTRNPEAEMGPASGEPAGGRILFADAKPNPVRAKEIGVGSIGDSRKPFRVGGG
jgi:hypothetical protein